MSMTPELKELLELAAKAIGNTLVIHGDGSTNLRCADGTYNWHPHLRGEDSQALQATLRLDVGFDEDLQEVFVRPADDHMADAVSEPYGRSVICAMRMAVLKAAAQIGRAM